MSADHAIDHRGRKPEEAAAHAGILEDIREEERRRVARELHDELGQKLVAFKLDLAWLADRLASEAGPLSEKVLAMKGQAEDTIKSVRRICNGLRPALLDELGLAAALDWLANDFSRRTGVAIELEAAAAEAIEDETLPTALFRITQECLTNVAKHARATRVEVSLSNRGSRLELRVTDNGTGAAAPAGHGGLGLAGIRERALMLGGWADISAAAGQGTAVVVSLPPGFRSA